MKEQTYDEIALRDLRHTSMLIRTVSSKEDYVYIVVSCGNVVGNLFRYILTSVEVKSVWRDQLIVGELFHGIALYLRTRGMDCPVCTYLSNWHYKVQHDGECAHIGYAEVCEAVYATNTMLEWFFDKLDMTFLSVMPIVNSLHVTDSTQFERDYIKTALGVTLLETPKLVD